MKIKLVMDCGYVGTDYEEEMEVSDDITEKELEKLALDFFGKILVAVMVMK